VQMPSLICQLCGGEIDPSGPGVSSYHHDHEPVVWRSSWVPFVEDLRGTPTRPVHAECFAAEVGVGALVQLVTAHDARVRLDRSQSWRRQQGPNDCLRCRNVHAIRGYVSALNAAR
jgi:hypothetical protein